MKSGRTVVTWEANDGYVGGARPQHTEIYLDELDDCDTEEEARQLIADSIQSSFEQRVSPSWEQKEEDAVIKLWKKHRESKKED